MKATPRKTVWRQIGIESTFEYQQSMDMSKVIWIPFLHSSNQCHMTYEHVYKRANLFRKNQRVINYQKGFGYIISMKSTKFLLGSWFFGVIWTLSDVWNSLRACTHISASTLTIGPETELPFVFISWASQLVTCRMGSWWLINKACSVWFEKNG